MSTVREAAIESLASNGMASYTRPAAPVLDDLTDWADEVADRLVEFADNQGLRRDAAERLMTEVGLRVPPPAPAAVASNGGGSMEAVQAAVQAISDKLDRALEFARSHGYRG